MVLSDQKRKNLRNEASRYVAGEVPDYLPGQVKAVFQDLLQALDDLDEFAPLEVCVQFRAAGGGPIFNDEDEARIAAKNTNKGLESRTVTSVLARRSRVVKYLHVSPWEPVEVKKPTQRSDATHYAVYGAAIRDAYEDRDGLWLWSVWWQGWFRAGTAHSYLTYPKERFVKATAVGGAEVLIKREFIETPGRD